MQKASQGANWTENADNADEAEIVQSAYYLMFANGMREMRKGLAERGGFSSTRYRKSLESNHLWNNSFIFFLLSEISIVS
jgi:hypothetical protein